MRALLLPGMDGTGDLFAPLVRALAPDLAAEVCAYPVDRALGYEALEALVRGRFTSAPTIVVAESFSGHVGVGLASDPPPGLLGVVLAAAFVAPPAPRALSAIVRPALFGRPPPAFAVRALLVGRDAESALVDDVRAAIARVRSEVLADRLRSVLREDSRDALARARVPLMRIRPTRDRLLFGTAGFGKIGSSDVVAIDAPHLVLQRAPSEAAAAIRGFASRLG